MTELQKAHPPIFTNAELDLIRQWFNAVEDLSPKYLEERDYQLAKRISDALGVKFSDPRKRRA